MGMIKCKHYATNEIKEFDESDVILKRYENRIFIKNTSWMVLDIINDKEIQNE